MDLRSDDLPQIPSNALYRRCISLIKDWSVTLPEDLILGFNVWFRDDQSFGNFGWIFSAYAHKLALHAEELGYLESNGRASNIVGAGMFCYVGQLIMYYCQFGHWQDNQEKVPSGIVHGDMVSDYLFNFVLLYLYVDYFIDSTKIDGQTKKSTLAVMYKLIEDPDCMPPPTKMQGLVESYKKILAEVPISKPTLIKLFNTEVATVKVQNNPHASRSEYMKAAMDKGGMTASAIQATFGDLSLDKTFEVGAILQLLDDMMDVFEDLEDNTHTVATYDLKRYGFLDYLFFLTMDMIYALDPVFTTFKILLTQVLTYVVSMDRRFTRKLQRMVLPYSLIRWTQGSHAMDICNHKVIRLVKEIRTTTSLAN